MVKVEIWDIVDKGKVKKRDGLKMDTEEADLVNLIVFGKAPFYLNMLYH